MNILCEFLYAAKSCIFHVLIDIKAEIKQLHFTGCHTSKSNK